MLDRRPPPYLLALVWLGAIAFALSGWVAIGLALGSGR